LAYIYRCFGTTCCLHFQGRWVRNKHCVIYGSDGWWKGEKEREKTTKGVLERAVIIGPYKAQIEETKSWHEVIRECLGPQKKTKYGGSKTLKD
jgi:hypothetical protein